MKCYTRFKRNLALWTFQLSTCTLQLKDIPHAVRAWCVFAARPRGHRVVTDGGKRQRNPFRVSKQRVSKYVHSIRRSGTVYLFWPVAPPAPSSFALDVPEFWGSLHYAALTVYGRGMDEDLSIRSTVYYTISAAGCQVRSSPAQVNLRTLGIRTSRISALTVIRCRLSFHSQPASLLFYLYVFG